MVGDWSPDPPREADEQLTNSTHAVFFESEDSEEDTYTNPPIGYELLFAPSTGLTSDEEEESDNCEDVNHEEEENSEEVGETSVAGLSAPSSAVPLDVTEHLAQVRRSEIEEVAALYTPDAPRPDISVNCDEVRAAMSGFTLPPSSIPPWAENIPEAQWAAALMQQLQRLLTKDDSSKPTS